MYATWSAIHDSVENASEEWTRRDALKVHSPACSETNWFSCPWTTERGRTWAVIRYIVRVAGMHFTQHQKLSHWWYLMKTQTLQLQNKRKDFAVWNKRPIINTHIRFSNQWPFLIWMYGSPQSESQCRIVTVLLDLPPDQNPPLTSTSV